MQEIFVRRNPLRLSRGFEICFDAIIDVGLERYEFGVEISANIYGTDPVSL
jgi:hypothetical protein